MERQNLMQLLSANPYPGRGIVIGNRYRPGANAAVIAYWIMGRSENSATGSLRPRRMVSGRRPLMRAK